VEVLVVQVVTVAVVQVEVVLCLGPAFLLLLYQPP
jgi:hypothetical protein